MGGVGEAAEGADREGGGDQGVVLAHGVDGVHPVAVFALALEDCLDELVANRFELWAVEGVQLPDVAEGGRGVEVETVDRGWTGVVGQGGGGQ